MDLDTAARILIAEDEPSLAEAMRYALEREGYRCMVASDGVDALRRYRADAPDLVVLDLMLPGVAGEEICRTVRSEGATAIIIVSAKSAETDRVIGLELGADDYLPKPFGTRELVARVRSVLRRSRPTGARETIDAPAHASAPLVVGPVRLDLDRHEAWVEGRPLALPPKEFDLLASLMQRAGKLCTRDLLIAEVWGPAYYGDTRTLDVHVKRLRAKIEADPRAPRLLRTVRGLGYKLEA